jgi:branched-chain amino acid transport system substrate-binding protein
MGDVIGERDSESAISRRELIVRAGAGAGGLLLSGVAAEPVWARARGAAADQITIGFVSPRTGPAAGFGEPDPYVIGLAKKAFAKGLTIGGKTYSVKIVDKDSQSNPAHAAQVANDLLHGSNVNVRGSLSRCQTCVLLSRTAPIE